MKALEYRKHLFQILFFETNPIVLDCDFAELFAGNALKFRERTLTTGWAPFG